MNPWDRQPGETATAYNAFVVYLLMGADRSLAKCSRKVGHAQKVTCEVWSRKNGWVHRAAAYDAHLASGQIEAQKQTAVTAEIEAFRERARDASIAAFSSALRILKKLSPAIDSLNVGKLKPAEIAALARAALVGIEFGLNSEAVAIGADRLAEAIGSGEKADDPISQPS